MLKFDFKKYSYSSTWGIGILMNLRFSQLHNGTRFLLDPRAKVFFWVLASIAKTRPALALLENVVGILRVWKKETRLDHWKLLFWCPLVFRMFSSIAFYL